MRKSQVFISCGGELPLPESFMAGVTTYNSQFLTQSRKSMDHLCGETIIFSNKQHLFLVFMMWSKRSKLPKVTHRL
jgi:hypothetical protein